MVLHYSHQFSYFNAKLLQRSNKSFEASLKSINSVLRSKKAAYESDLLQLNHFELFSIQISSDRADINNDHILTVESNTARYCREHVRFVVRRVSFLQQNERINRNYCDQRFKWIIIELLRLESPNWNSALCIQRLFIYFASNLWSDLFKNCYFINQ